jgi:DNA-binding PadR family transcriptional regulator
MSEDFSSHLPLSPAALHILLALAAGDRHGYGIMQDVVQQTEGRYKLGPGTLYDNLDKLMSNGLVGEARHSGAKDDPRRRYYRLTSSGRNLLAAEVQRLETVVREARTHLRTSPGRAS